MVSLFWSVTLMLLTFLIVWMLYGRYQDRIALQTAQKKFGKHNVRRMGLLSELWQIMYDTNNAPTIHAFQTVTFENINSLNADPFELLLSFWSNFGKKYINFRCIPIKTNGKWFWVEKTEFDPSKQIKKIQLSSKDKLTQFLNDSKLNHPFDPNLPFWEVYYITFAQQENEAVAYARFHHALGDGILLNKIITMEQSKNSKHCKTWQNRRPITPKSLTMRVYHLLRYLPFAVTDLLSLFIFESAPFESAVHCTYKNFGKQENQNRKFQIAISKCLPLVEIKKLTKRYGGTVNDFVMTVFCHAVNKYLKQLNAKQVKWLRFFTIFDMRSLLLTKQENLETSMSNYAAGIGVENNVSTVPIALPCGDMSFVERFKIVHGLFYKLKNGPTPIITMLMLQVGHFIFGLRFVNYFLGQMVARKCSFTLSNLIGPKTQIALEDMEEIGSSGGNYISNCFNVTNPTHVPSACGIMSYAENITFTLCCDENAIQYPQKFMDCLHHVFQDMSSFQLK